MPRLKGKKNQQGGWDEVTDWHNVTLFGKTAEAAGQYLSKGRQVYIEGRISYNSYERDGVKKYYTDILGNRMQMLGSREGGARQDGGQYQQNQNTQQAPPQNTPPQQQQNTNDYEDDLPF